MYYTLIFLGFASFCIIVAIIAAYIKAGWDKQDQLDTAYRKYQACLQSLKADPNNPDLRQAALKLGRNYSNLTRKSKGVTIYDESGPQERY